MLWVTRVVVALAVARMTHPHLGLVGTTFLGARLAYAAVSLAGIPLVRSLFWTIGFAATVYLGWIVWASFGAAA